MLTSIFDQHVRKMSFTTTTSYVDSSDMPSMGAESSSVLTMPSDDWPRQQWARLTRVLAGVNQRRRQRHRRRARTPDERDHATAAMPTSSQHRAVLPPQQET